MWYRHWDGQPNFPSYFLTWVVDLRFVVLSFKVLSAEHVAHFQVDTLNVRICLWVFDRRRLAVDITALAWQHLPKLYPNELTSIIVYHLLWVGIPKKEIYVKSFSDKLTGLARKSAPRLDGSERLDLDVQYFSSRRVFKLVRPQSSTIDVYPEPWCWILSSSLSGLFPYFLCPWFWTSCRDHNFPLGKWCLP